MCFIVVAIINRNLAPLTYYTHDEVVLYDIMQVSVRNKMDARHNRADNIKSKL